MSSSFIGLIISFVLWSTDQEIPLKSTDEFEVKLDYKLKDRPQADKPAYEAPNSNTPKATGPLPYLKTDIILKSIQPDEIRLRVLNAKGATVANRKLSPNEVIKIDWGFTEDVKDRIVSHQYTIQFLNSGKKPVSQIILIIEEDGTLVVNNSKRGKL